MRITTQARGKNKRSCAATILPVTYIRRGGKPTSKLSFPQQQQQPKRAYVQTSLITVGSDRCRFCSHGWGDFAHAAGPSSTYKQHAILHARPIVYTHTTVRLRVLIYIYIFQTPTIPQEHLYNILYDSHGTITIILTILPILTTDYILN